MQLFVEINVIYLIRLDGQLVTKVIQLSFKGLYKKERYLLAVSAKSYGECCTVNYFHCC